MLYVVFHGSTGGIGQVYSYKDSGGAPVNEAVLDIPESSLKSTPELRDIEIGPDGLLYVVNSHSSGSEILRFEGSPDKKGQHKFVDYFVQASEGGDSLAALVHPFAIAFNSPASSCFVSNQDTNVVMGLTNVPGKSGRPEPTASSLSAFGDVFLPGTFVASAVANLPKANPKFQPPAVPTPAGLQASVADNKVANSVRDVLLWGNSLYVCDEPGNAVKIYDATTGAYTGSVPDGNSLIQSPVHLLLFDNWLYIACATQVLKWQLGSTNDAVTYIDGMKHPTGMAVDDKGRFYVASLKDKTVYTYANNQLSAIVSTPDVPEFLMYIHG